jgi:predicted acetylornithine/succinylornithine family transaminase
MDTQTGRISPVIDAEQTRAWDAAHVMGTYARQPVLFVRGQGAKLWDSDGKEYLDFLTGLAVNGLGHCHPRVVKAIQEQAATLIHTSNLYLTAPQAALAHKLTAISDFERVFFCNSGAEANECAIKIARKHGKAVGGNTKFGIVTAQRSFHGRTMATVTATAQPKYQAPFAPMLPGVTYVSPDDVAALDQAVGPDTCAVILEPIQGESGVYPLTPEFLQAARSICDEHRALLIFDEIQTGMGRTGEWWCYQHGSVVPDIMTLAKSLGGGMPIGACLARGSAATTLVPGDHGSTFAGSPLAAAAALAAIEAIEDEHLVANACAMGMYLKHRLGEPRFATRVKEIRGIGLMVGIELAAEGARKAQSAALERGLIINAIGDTILRLLPPLIVTQDEIDHAVAILDEVI